MCVFFSALCTKFRILAFCIGLALFAIAQFPVNAQQTTATLLGTVGDASGGLISGVRVKVTNLATNAERETQTDQAGYYSVPNLPAGNYKVTATKEGFQVQQFDNLTLQVEQSARLAIVMQIGNVAETVNVSASANLLQTENASVGTVIDSGKIVDLPLTLNRKSRQ